MTNETQTEVTAEAIEAIDNASSEELEAMLEQGTQPEPTSEAEPEAEQATQDDEPSEELSLEDRLQALEENNTKLSKRLSDKDEFISRRNAEIGELRKQVRDKELDNLSDEVDVNEDEFFEDPKAAIEKVIEARKRKEAILEADKAEQAKKFHEDTRQLITTIDPEFDDRIPEIVSILKADDAPENVLKAFKDKPFTTFNPAVTLQLIKRAGLEKQIAELKASLADAQNKPNKMLDNLNRFGKNKSKVTSSRPSGKKPSKSLDGLSMKDIDNMSYEDLKALEESLVK